MLLGLDVLMRGLFRLLRLELGMDTLLVDVYKRQSPRWRRRGWACR